MSLEEHEALTYNRGQLLLLSLYFTRKYDLQLI